MEVEVQLQRIQESKSEFSAIGKLHNDCDGFSSRLTMHSYKFESTFHAHTDFVSHQDDILAISIEQINKSGPT